MIRLSCLFQLPFLFLNGDRLTTFRVWYRHHIRVHDHGDKDDKSNISHQHKRRENQYQFTASIGTESLSAAVVRRVQTVSELIPSAEGKEHQCQNPAKEELSRRAHEIR